MSVPDKLHLQYARLRKSHHGPSRVLRGGNAADRSRTTYGHAIRAGALARICSTVWKRLEGASAGELTYSLLNSWVCETTTCRCVRRRIQAQPVQLHESCRLQIYDAPTPGAVFHICFSRTTEISTAAVRMLAKVRPSCTALNLPTGNILAVELVQYSKMLQLPHHNYSLSSSASRHKYSLNASAPRNTLVTVGGS